MRRGHEFKFWKQPFAEMQEKAVYIRPKVVEPFPRPCASGSYVHWETFLRPIFECGKQIIDQIAGCSFWH
jgi:hypothetical protein